jgi:hypothetical protein
MKTIPDLKINLPPWPAQRVIREAVLSWNLRSPQQIDAETVHWHHLRRVITAFLRHRLTDYDQRLEELCRHDQAARDGLVQAIYQVATKVYPWFRNDPRPFANLPPDHRFLEQHASEVSKLQNLIEHLRSAIADLSRHPKENQQRLQQLKVRLGEALVKKDKSWEILTTPDHTDFNRCDRKGASGQCNTRVLRNSTGSYYFLTPKPLTPNTYKFLPFSCPKCGVRVVETKRPRDIGQGKKAYIQTCLCLAVLISPPPDYAVLAPVTLKRWAWLVENGEVDQ